MELLLFLIIPVVVALLLLFFYKKEVTIQEAIGIVIPSFIIIGICYAVSYFSLTNSTEYYGDYAVKITHYDDWDEWIHRTCTRQVACGTDSKGRTRYRTETYDCSYRDYHPDRWVITTKSGNELYIDEPIYNKIRKQWNVKEHFKDMHRHYYTKDGDAKYYVWDDNISTLFDITTTHNYTNKIKASKSIFAFEDISKKEAKKLGLFDYPKVVDYEQNPINGYRKITKADEQSLRMVNGLYGAKHEIRVFLNCFYNKDLSISKKQQSYWVGGNKNEFVINVCLDSLSNKLLWIDAFSWMDEPKLEVKTEQFIRDLDTLNIVKASDYLYNEIPTSWKRKEFKDFDYISIELTETQFYVTLFIVIAYVIISSIIFIKNDYKNENV